VHLGLLRSLVAAGSAAADTEAGAVSTAQTAARSALAAVEELSHGLYPARLADHGLAVALERAAGDGPLQVTVQGQEVPRVEPDVEAAVYFCCLEAMQNAAKHGRASRVEIAVAVHEGALTFTVSDDGDGFVTPGTSPGSGMQNMRDRLEALAGSLAVTSAPGAGTTVSGRVPVRNPPFGRRLPAPRSAAPAVAGH
jgi:signal transduction histidine kinase